MSSFKEKILKSVLFRTVVGIFSIIIFSILSGAFIAEITIDGTLRWNLFYKTKSFYFLIASCFLMYFYFRFQLEKDESIEKFKDDDYCKAYMRKQCLPEMAKKANEWIKNGKSKDHLKDIMSDLNL
jgi:hypothetical protein